MIIVFDEERGTVAARETTDSQTCEYALSDPRGFALMARAWLRAGWDAKYVYTFTWMGRPIIQLPDDVLRLQEVIFNTRPTVIVETGVAHGGSLIFHASLLRAMGIDGRVIGVDVEIRSANRRAIEAHALAPMITLIEADSVAEATFAAVNDLVGERDVVLAILDSNHTRDHVLRELSLYSKLVTPGSYIVATDGIMRDLAGAPRSQPDWETNNPYAAACAFVAANPNFVQQQPTWPFNESTGLSADVTYWPGAWLRRVR